MKTALALGSFDGVHIAHRFVLDLPEGYKKAVVTFEKPPKMLFDRKNELIMTLEDRITALKTLGYSEVVVLDFEKVRDTRASEFLEFLYNSYQPEIISCGFNYRFGKGGKGDVSLLQDFCNKKGISLRVCDKVTFEGEAVSSTLIRNRLKNGEIEKANALMQIPFSFSGEVIKGDRRGRTIGFPTINQKYPEDLVKIKFGVYRVRVLFDGVTYDGISNIGMRPSFASDFPISETYIKDFSGDLYGKTVKIIPQSFLRPEIKFASLDELKKQIEKDINQIK